MRFNIPLNIKFKPKNDESDYSCGLTRNFSCEGMSFETQNSNFDLFPNECLELIVKFPQTGNFVSLSGDIIWRDTVGHKFLVGVKLQDMDKKGKRKILEKISTFGNLSVDRIFFDKDPESVSKERFGFLCSSQLSGKQTIEDTSVTRVIKKGMLKQYLKTCPKCRVTFRLPKEAAQEAQVVMVVGDFNGWSTTETPMKRLRTGDFMLTLEFPRNREFRFRYFIDGSRWENDWNADRYFPNPYGGEDSVLIL
jgi:hypothetical protein